MNITQKHPARLAVANLSTGNQPNQYYDEVSHWWERLLAALLEHNLEPVCIDCPQVYNGEGAAHVTLQTIGGIEVDSRLRWTWYRMPSGRWEIISYLT